jgi:hypothetical protein
VSSVPAGSASSRTLSVNVASGPDAATEEATEEEPQAAIKRPVASSGAGASDRRRPMRAAEARASGLTEA